MKASFNTTLWPFVTCVIEGRVNEETSFQDYLTLWSKLYVSASQKKERFSFKIPFSSETILSDLYVKKLDPPDIAITSPVPRSENWRYWQNVNLVSINDIANSDYSKSLLSLPTPFSFYTGDHGKIINHVKSWVAE